MAVEAAGRRVYPVVFIDALMLRIRDGGAVHPGPHLDPAQQPVGSDIWIALAWCFGILVVADVFAMTDCRRKIG